MSFEQLLSCYAVMFMEVRDKHQKAVLLDSALQLFRPSSRSPSNLSSTKFQSYSKRQNQRQLTSILPLSRADTSTSASIPQSSMTMGSNVYYKEPFAYLKPSLSAIEERSPELPSLKCCESLIPTGMIIAASPSPSQPFSDFTWPSWDPISHKINLFHGSVTFAVTGNLNNNRLIYSGFVLHGSQHNPARCCVKSKFKKPNTLK